MKVAVRLVAAVASASGAPLPSRKILEHEFDGIHVVRRKLEAIIKVADSRTVNMSTEATGARSVRLQATDLSRTIDPHRDAQTSPQ